MAKKKIIDDYYILPIEPSKIEWKKSVRKRNQSPKLKITELTNRFIDWKESFNPQKNHIKYKDFFYKWYLYERTYNLTQYNNLVILYNFFNIPMKLPSIIELNKIWCEYQKTILSDFKLFPIHLVYNKNWWK